MAMMGVPYFGTGLAEYVLTNNVFIRLTRMESLRRDPSACCLTLHLDGEGNMKDAIKERLDWVSGSLGAHFVFFVIGSVVCLKGLADGHCGLSAQLYLAVSVLLLVVTAVNAIVSFGVLRHFLGLIFVLTSCFAIPFAMNAYGFDLSYVVLFGMLYAMAIIAISPKYVGFATLLASIAFACYLHYDAVVFRKLPVYDKDLAGLERRLVTEGEASLKAAGVGFFKVSKEMSLQDISSQKEVYGDPTKWDVLYKANRSRVDGPDKNVQAGTLMLVPPLPQLAPYDFMKLGFWFVAGALLAFCWRLLVGKMYELFTLSSNNTSKAVLRQIDDLNGQLDSSRREFNLLKEEVSLQIIEMNKITGFKK